jgi:hypothetical protein
MSSVHGLMDFSINDERDINKSSNFKENSIPLKDS